MAEQPAPCPEEAAPYNNPEPPTVSALAEGVPPMGGSCHRPLSLWLSGAEHRRGKGLEEGQPVGGERASP